MTENIIVAKTYSFAVKIVKFCFEIQDVKREYVLSRQLLKSGTSVGANTEESQGAISKADLLQKCKLRLRKQKRQSFGFV